MRPEVADAILKRASERYVSDYQSLEAIKAEMVKVVVAEVRHGMSLREAFSKFKQTKSLKHIEPGRLALGIGEKALDAVALLPRTLMTSGDQSIPGRQGFLANVGHPLDALRSMAHQNRAMYGEKGMTNLASRFKEGNFFKKNERRVGMSGEQYAKHIDEGIKGRENYPIYKEAGLEIISLDDVGNPFMAEDEFWEFAITYAALGGNFYLWKERSQLGVPIALWPFHDGQLRPILHPTRWISGYALDVGPGHHEETRG